MYNVLLVVDMQNDFISGALKTNESEEVVRNVVNRISNSRGELILFTQDTHGPDYLNTPEGKKLPVTHCVEGTWGWEIVPAVKEAWYKNPYTIIASEPIENTFKKPIFGSTALVDFLLTKKDKIISIEVLGVCTDICVISNAIMLKNAMPDIDLSVNAKCCAGVTPESHLQALNIMKMCHILETETPLPTKEIYLAGGCFWGVEKYLQQTNGVIKTEVGYANGNTKNPTYEDICATDTGFAETVRVVYDISVLDLEAILTRFYNIIEPTVINRQGPDVGSQYRTGIYFTDNKDKEIITKSLSNLQNSYEKPIVVENMPLKIFYRAEENHQKYLDKNPGGYCHIPPSKFVK